MFVDILDQLKHKGYRLTKPRQELLHVLVDYPLTVHEIYSTLQKKNISIDLASVYRSLELFVNMGIVRVIELNDNKKRYELVDIHNHHHHLICTNCKTIEDVNINENNFLKEMQRKSAFKVDHHHLEFFGLCKNCQ